MSTEGKTWHIVEIMGRRKLAGMAQEVRRYGVDGISVEPLIGDALGPMQFYPGTSLFAVREVTEQEARAAAQGWECRQSLQLMEIATPVALLGDGGALSLGERIEKARHRLKGPSALLQHHLARILRGEDVDQDERPSSTCWTSCRIRSSAARWARITPSGIM
jgi:hypothetical protein